VCSLILKFTATISTHVRLQREVAALKEQINKAHHQPEEKEGEDLNNAEIPKGNKTNSGDGGGGDDDNDDSDGDGEDEDEEEDDDYEWDGQGDPKKTSSLLKRANSGKSKKGKSKKSKSKKGTRERVNKKYTNREKKRGLVRLWSKFKFLCCDFIPHMLIFDVSVILLSCIEMGSSVVFARDNPLRKRPQ
jgi:hypothetical protein